jgi:glycosyltransferase involved in cell wall biosynthesis
MKILVACIPLPWPLDAGGKVAVYSSLACLRKDHCFTLVSPVFSEQGLADAAALQAALPEIKVRAVHCGPAARPKDDILIRSARWGARQYRRWRNAPPLAAVPRDPQIPYYPFAPLPEPYLNAVAEELSQSIDLVQAEFAENLSLGAWLPAGIPKIFIHHQLHFVYARRFTAARKVRGYSNYLEKMMCLQEEAYLRNFDGVVVFSEEDKRALADWLPGGKVHVSPFPIASGCDIAAFPPGDFRGHFTFMGSEEHFPNRDGLEWLTSEVWPEIAKRVPGSKLRVIGPWGETSRARFSRPDIEFLGFVEDLNHATQGSIMLVPLRIGSGIRVKLLDALSLGVPAISTSIGCEGIPASDGVDILIRDDAAGFAAAAAAAANNRELRARLAGAGRELVARLYSPEQVRRRRNEIYQSVCGVVSR